MVDMNLWDAEDCLLDTMAIPRRLVPSRVTAEMVVFAIPPPIPCRPRSIHAVTPNFDDTDRHLFWTLPRDHGSR